MNKVQSYEALLYWRCKCEYENTSYWLYDGDESYTFQCDGCGEKSLVDPPKPVDCSACKLDPSYSACEDCRRNESRPDNFTPGKKSVD